MSTRALTALLTLSCILGLSSCGNYELVDSSELARLKTAEAQVQKLQTENAQLTAELASAKNVGRYQIHQFGLRTWRLDTTTGADCILLASEADWKKPETRAQGCASQ